MYYGRLWVLYLLSLIQTIKCLLGSIWNRKISVFPSLKIPDCDFGGFFCCQCGLMDPGIALRFVLIEEQHWVPKYPNKKRKGTSKFLVFIGALSINLRIHWYICIYIYTLGMPQNLWTHLAAAVLKGCIDYVCNPHRFNVAYSYAKFTRGYIWFVQGCQNAVPVIPKWQEFLGPKMVTIFTVYPINVA